MDKDTTQKILDAAKTYGDLDTAIAAHLFGEAVIIRSGGRVPAGADLAAIAAVRAELTGPVDLTSFLQKVEAIVKGK